MTAICIHRYSAQEAMSLGVAFELLLAVVISCHEFVTRIDSLIDYIVKITKQRIASQKQSREQRSVHA